MNTVLRSGPSEPYFSRETISLEDAARLTGSPDFDWEPIPAGGNQHVLPSIDGVNLTRSRRRSMLRAWGLLIAIAGMGAAFAWGW